MQNCRMLALLCDSKFFRRLKMRKATQISQIWDRDIYYLLVNRVVVGNPLTRQYNAEELTELPFGYHSVVGVPGADLNYAETVVYANDAIRPAYLIVYAADVPPEVHVADLRSILSTLFKTPIAS
ncbi:hypothetical protein B0H12DRAFT_700372 [Mycena haematopus]|nr:hypothetical protein B0H12DRAFT_700372 [Mycena haematopus]